MPQAVTIRSLPRAFAMIKAMQDQGYEWREDYRQCGREALVEILEEQMQLLSVGVNVVPASWRI